MRTVAYYRVSTRQQGTSGLGLEAQQAAVGHFLEDRSWTVVASFTEVESGKRSDRPKLLEAIAACHLHHATLVIAKLDRLSRNAAFLLNLRDAGIEFVCCDMPYANRLTITILAAVAEDEAERISSRTKAALAAAKARGTVLGGCREHGHKFTAQDQRKSAALRRQKALAGAIPVLREIEKLKTQGITLPYAVAKALNARNIPAPRGGTWQMSQVEHVQRLKESQQVDI